MLVVLMAANWAISTYIGPERWVENLVIAGSLILYLLVLQFFRNPVVHTTINDSFINTNTYIFGINCQGASLG